MIYCVFFWSRSTGRLKCQCFWFETSQKTVLQLKVSFDRLMGPGIEHGVNWQQWKSCRSLSKFQLNRHELIQTARADQVLRICRYGGTFFARVPLSNPIITLQY